MAAKLDDGHIDILITASEAYPALENAFLKAKTIIRGGFRVFDLETKLRSPEGRDIGEIWSDLIVDTVNRGVVVDITLSDFDPVVGSKLHGQTGKTLRLAKELKSRVKRPDNLRIQKHRHPAQIGRANAILLWPKTRSLIAKLANDYNALDAGGRETFLQDRPGLSELFVMSKNGRARARKWPAFRLMPVTHHHKLAVFDETSVYIGGLDVNDRRFDDLNHDRSSPKTWQDLQLMIRDPDLARDATAFLGNLPEWTAGKGALGQPKSGFLRTVSAARSDVWTSMSPRPRRSEIFDAHLKAIGQARGLIYIETQFFRDQALARALARVADNDPDLGLVMVLPAAPEDVAFEGSKRSDARYGEYLQAKSLDLVQAGFQDRAVFACPVLQTEAAESGRGVVANSPIIYLHSKVSIFGTDRAIVSSANLNRRSQQWDSEAGVLIETPEFVTRLRDRCLCHWWPDAALALPSSGKSAAAVLRRWIGSDAGATQPESRDGFLVPYPVEPARRFGRNLPGVPEGMV